jgi:hypothetical protein
MDPMVPDLETGFQRKNLQIVTIVLTSIYLYDKMSTVILQLEKMKGSWLVKKEKVQ